MREILALPDQIDGRAWLYHFTGYQHPLHHHDELEVNLIVSGTGRYLIDGRRYDLARHHMLWLFPGQDHVLFDQSPDFKMWIVVWKQPLVKRCCRTSPFNVLKEFTPKGEFLARIAPAHALRTHEFLQELAGLDYLKTQTVRYNAGLVYALFSAWETFLSQGTEGSGSQLHPAVEKAARLIRDQILTQGENAEWKQIAKEAGLSSSRLGRLFTKQTGVSPVDFRNRLRLERFMGLYGNGQQRNMLECALQSGFGSYPQFHRIFKRYMGTGPAEYRRKQKV